MRAHTASRFPAPFSSLLWHFRFRPLAALVMMLGLAFSARADMASINQTVWKIKYGVTDSQAANGTWLNADDDGDGIKNGDELAAGTNPFSASKTIAVTKITRNGSNVTLEFPTEDGKRYRAESTTTIAVPGSWQLQPQPEPAVFPGTGATGSIQIPYVAGSFYRVRVDDTSTMNDGVSDWAKKILGYDVHSTMKDGRTLDANAIPAALAQMNQVTVTVTKPSATQPSDSLTAPVDIGSVVVSRGLSKVGTLTAPAITVNLQKGGSATEGTDYDSLPTLWSFPAGSLAYQSGGGANQKVFTINPRHNASRRSNVTAVVKALPGTGYTLGSANAASVVINPPGVANGTGLTGYYHNASSTDYATQDTTIFSGAAEMTRVDGTIDFNGIASISTGNPCTVTTVNPHGLLNGTPVTISGVAFTTNPPAFTPSINGTFTATVTGANTFTVASNCTALPNSLMVASVSGNNGVAAISTSGNPTTITTRVPHNFGANGTALPVAINWFNGTSSLAINATHTATVTGASTFTIPFNNTATPNSGQLANATITGPAGVNGWGSTSGPVGMSSPATGGAWSVRWVGQVMPQYSETYTFDLRTNESAKLWVNGQLLIDRWTAQTGVQEITNTITLKAGILYDIQIDYFKSAPSAVGSGIAEARLYWWSPSQVKQIIPQNRLFPAPASNAAKFTAVTSNISVVGYVGVPLTFNLNATATGASTTYALDANSGPLPPGTLALNSSTGQITGTPSTAGTYNVAVNATNVEAGTVTGSTAVTFTIFPTGSVTREILNGDGSFTADGTIPALDDDTNYPAATARRLRGYIVPPKTGNYYFWLAANNYAELWISNDSEYVNRVRRVKVSAGTGKKAWNTASTQQSPWLALEAGRKYYFEVLHNTPGGADDYVNMGWCQDDIGTVPSTSTAPNAAGTRTSIPDGGAALQGYPLSGTAPSYIFQAYDYPTAVTGTGALYSTNLGPQGTATTTASGSANLRIDPSGTFATLHFSYQNLSSPRTAYHLHADAYGSHSQGEIVYDIDDADAFHPEQKTADGGYIWNLSGDLLSGIQQGKIYLNIHSASYPSGEIRGNLTLVDGSQTAPKASDYPEPSAMDNSSVPAILVSPSNPTHAARFLNQATFGASPTEVTNVGTLGFEGWINAQLAKSPSYTSDDVVNGVTADINATYAYYLFTNAWWKFSIMGQDQLRQRLAFALSEIMVISWNNDTGPLANNGRILADYYDQLLAYCLPTAGVPESGTFRGLLKAVTLTPAMGKYLDMLANQKGDDTIGRHPNENYAREIMQLFSVGLNRMWDDGKFVLDSNANLVPTYTQPTILGLSALLTGWNYSQANQGNGRAPTGTNPGANYLNPMVLVPAQHEQRTKLLLDNVVAPGATGLTPRVSISSIAVSSPAGSPPCTVTTSTEHGLTTGDTVTIAGVTGGTFTTGGPINANFQVTVTGTKTFTVPVCCTGAAGTAGTVTGPTILAAGFGTGGIAAVTGSQSDNSNFSGWSLPHPYDQYGLNELETAIDNIVNNDNVAPYICRQLIQRFVTSNPSPGYLFRVVQKFKDNGSGVRGDMVAVIKQILLDGEARSTPAPGVTGFGKQREPVTRLTGPARAFPAIPYTGTYKQLTGVNSNKLRISTSTPNDFSQNFTVSLDFRGNYSPSGQTLTPGDVPTSGTYTVGTTLGISGTASITGTGVSITAINTGNPCKVTTSAAHNLTTGDAVTISGFTNGTFSPTINGTFQVTVVDATSFTVASNCTVAPTNYASALETPYFTEITTVENHGLSVGNVVTISGVTGTGFTPTINGTFTVVAVGSATTFRVPVKQTTAPTSVASAQIVGANTMDVNATGMTNASYSQTAGSNLLTVSTSGPITDAPVSGTTVAISSITTGTPCTITTSAANNLVNGGRVTIAGMNDPNAVFSASINGTFTVSNVSGNSFTVPVNCTTAPTDYSTATTTKLIRSKVYLMFLSQTAAGGASLPGSGVYDVQTNPSGSSFTVQTADTPVTARAGNVIVPKFASSYTPQKSVSNLAYYDLVQFNNNANHNLAVGTSIWVDAPVVTPRPIADAEYVVSTLVDEDHFKTSSLPSVTNGGSYPYPPSNSQNSFTIYPLVAPPMGRTGVVSINQSTFDLKTTESTLTQSPLNSPTVFNFFFPNYRFPGTLSASNTDSPEFQLTTDTNVVNLSNSLTNMIIGTVGGNGNANGLSSFNNGGGSVVMDIGPYMTTGYTTNANIPTLVDALSSLLIGGPLDAANRTTIINCVANTTNFPMTTPTPTNAQMRDRVRAVIHLIITSAEYAVQK